jgi:hypothetical protein
MNFRSRRDHYNPNQPRVPAGQTGGGRWTRDPSASAPIIATRNFSKHGVWHTRAESHRSDGSLEEEVHFNRDGSIVWSRFSLPDAADWEEEHRLVLPDGSRYTIELAGPLQRTFDEHGQLVQASELSKAQFAQLVRAGRSRLVMQDSAGSAESDPYQDENVIKASLEVPDSRDRSPVGERSQSQRIAISRKLEQQCEAQYDRDMFHCRMVGLRACYAHAMLRRELCRKGLPVPPLNY